MLFQLIYRTTDGESLVRVLTGPEDATIERCERVVRLVADTYGIDPESLEIAVVPRRVCSGFLHPIENVLPDGRIATVTGWYF